MANTVEYRWACTDRAWITHALEVLAILVTWYVTCQPHQAASATTVMLPLCIPTPLLYTITGTQPAQLNHEHRPGSPGAPARGPATSNDWHQRQRLAVFTCSCCNTATRHHSLCTAPPCTPTHIQFTNVQLCSP